MEERSINGYWTSDEENIWFEESFQEIYNPNLFLDEFKADTSSSPLPTTIDRIVTEFQKKIKTNGKTPEEYVKEYQETYDPKEKKRLKELITAHYIRMLAKLAIKIARQYQIPEDLYPDLLNESILVLHRCLTNFDHSRGVKFSSYLYRAAFSGIKRAILTKFHLVRDKSYLHKYSEKEPEEDKYEYIRLEEPVITKILKSEDDNFRKIDIQLFVEKLLKEIPPSTRQLLIKIVKGEELTKIEREIFRRLKPHLAKYLKDKYGITKASDILE